MISVGSTVTPVEGPDVAITQEAINTEITKVSLNPEATRNEGCIENPEIPIVFCNPEATHNEGFVETPLENIKVAMNTIDIIKPEYINNNKAFNDKMETGVMLNTSMVVTITRVFSQRSDKN